MKNLKTVLGAVLVAAFLMSAMPGDNAITREGATVIVNTESIGKSIKGYAGATPVKIFIEKDKVVKVEALKNQEGPKYMAKAKKLLTKFEGKSVQKARKQKVDAVTGATFTSEALVKNVKKGLEYYQKNK
ncbi:MAG: FMN-binding protein [Prevotella sp.]|nr:FMN-binding protein [Prevotella sp.]